MKPELAIRKARVEDAEALVALINAIIRDTAITFASKEKTVNDIVNSIEAAPEIFHVAEFAGRVVGYATYAPFRNGAGYAHTMEHSIALVPDARGLGAGRALMAVIEDTARTDDVHSLIAGVSGENPGAIAFHTSLGFTEVAVLPEVGRKFGRWIDLVLMQKFL